MPLSYNGPNHNWTNSSRSLSISPCSAPQSHCPGAGQAIREPVYCFSYKKTRTAEHRKNRPWIDTYCFPVTLYKLIFYVLCSHHQAPCLQTRASAEDSARCGRLCALARLSRGRTTCRTSSRCTSWTSCTWGKARVRTYKLRLFHVDDQFQNLSLCLASRKADTFSIGFLGRIGGYGHIYPSQRQNLLPTLEILVQNFEKFQIFKILEKNCQVQSFFPKFPKPQRGRHWHQRGRRLLAWQFLFFIKSFQSSGYIT